MSPQQSYGETSGTLYCEQGVKVEWKQRDLAILGVFQSGENLKLAFFGTGSFKVEVGGVSFMAGVRWFPFRK
jgi:hypothetical protein